MANDWVDENCIPVRAIVQKFDHTKTINPLAAGQGKSAEYQFPTKCVVTITNPEIVDSGLSPSLAALGIRTKDIPDKLWFGEKNIIKLMEQNQAKFPVRMGLYIQFTPRPSGGWYANLKKVGLLSPFVGETPAREEKPEEPLPPLEDYPVDIPEPEAGFEPLIAMLRDWRGAIDEALKRMGR